MHHCAASSAAFFPACPCSIASSFTTPPTISPFTTTLWTRAGCPPGSPGGPASTKRWGTAAPPALQAMRTRVRTRTLLPLNLQGAGTEGVENWAPQVRKNSSEDRPDQLDPLFSSCYTPLVWSSPYHISFAEFFLNR